MNYGLTLTRFKILKISIQDVVATHQTFHWSHIKVVAKLTEENILVALKLIQAFYVTELEHASIRECIH